jgi:hypothetical protein
MAIKSTSVVSRLLRLGKRGVLVTLFSLVLTSAAVPSSAFAANLPHLMHPTDGQGDSPLVP